MIQRVEGLEPIGLETYAEVVHLAEPVRALRAEAAALVEALRGRKVWMVNSTARGGGVAEMMPRLVSLLRELGLGVEWVVMGTEEPAFFELTKRLHNLIHGKGDPRLDEGDRRLYAAVSSENAAALKPRVRRQDVVVVHDPQPLGMGALLRRELGVPLIFRCHIGLDEDTPETRAAWDFLRPWADACDHALFSVPEYIPGFLAGRAGIITPGIDPLGFKNRELHPHKLAGILKSAGLAQEDVAVVSLPMGSRDHNALMVNALQRCSSVVVQNSLREGFGLTVTEAMWKQCCVLGSRACGIRAQLRDDVDGRFIPDPRDPDGIADVLDAVLDDLPGRARLGRTAQRRVHDEFLVFTQVRRWLETLAGLVTRPRGDREPRSGV